MGSKKTDMARQRLPNLDSVTTIAEDGSRVFLHPADVTGRFTWWRRIFAVLLVAIYFSLPFIPVRGRPAVFLDVMNQRFHLFGMTFAAQDFFLAFFFITGLGFTLFFVTALFGRLWCGWACPHSVFLEQVFRPLERLLEGPPAQRRKLDALSWAHPSKLLRRGAKLILYLVISAVIAHFFLAYFISLPQLWSWVLQGPAAHPQAFIAVTAATGIIFFNFTWFREQLCVIICPYGRLQSALIDDDSLVIGYDEIRGEPRGKPRKDDPHPPFGDCVNCLRCVQVCPTGIDIRQGLQIECIGCANCIDACDAIMDEYGRERGLIRYDSQNGLQGRKRNFLRPRLYVYTFLLLLGASVMAYAFHTVQPVNMKAIRMSGMPYYLTEDSNLRNQYQVRVINKRDLPARLEVSTDAAYPGLRLSGFVGELTIEPSSEAVRTLIATLPGEDWEGSFTLGISVRGSYEDGVTFQLQDSVEFVGPNPALLHERLRRQQDQVTP